MHQPRHIACLFLMLGIACLPMACARYPEGGGPGNFPERVLIVEVEFAGTLNDAYYYFVAFDTDGGADTGPLPIVVGPYWGNGWSTGTVAAYVQYHGGTYRVYSPRVDAALLQAGSGILSVSGSPTPPISGTHRIRIGPIAYGSVAVSGTGMVTGAANTGSQNAGTYAIETDAEGRTVTGSVSFTKAERGGRDLRPAERAALDALNAGGVQLAPDSLAPLGITLELGAPAAGAQTLTVAQTQAAATDTFQSYFGLNDRVRDGVILANDQAEGSPAVLPGVVFRTGDLVQGGAVDVVTQYTSYAYDLGPPFAYELPAELGGRRLRFTLDLAQIGDPAGPIEMNVITTDRLELNPEVVLDKTYDGLGPEGTTWVSLSLASNRLFRNAEVPLREGIQDVYLGALSPSSLDPGQVDISDWQLEVRLTGR